ncbi:connexin 39.4 [Esox lucius]|uniref:Gap junction protein n=1 Tax=Esox lucius TaxID=8010 RepID=A0AAY5KH35_ESOLU|nr:connexin 39.4 [Esox lucius]
MSRGDWSFLEHLLEDGQEYSTGVGRVWLTVLFLFRMLVLGTAAESAWDDEQTDFECNTKQPGCTAVCYDKAFPISHFRYFVLQVIFVSTPTIFYYGYVAMRAAREKRVEAMVGVGDGGGEGDQGRRMWKERERNREVKRGDQIEELEEEKGGKGETFVKVLPEAPKLKGRILCAYAASIFLKVILEVGFIVGLWRLYGFVIPARFECVRDPCPHTVDCFVSRPTEKTIFTIYTQAIAAVSIVLNLVELLYLLQLAITHCLEKRYGQGQCTFSGATGIRPWPGAPGQEVEMVQAPSYQEREHLYLPAGEGGYTKPSHSSVDMGSGVRVDPGGHLPSYLTCMGATHSQERTHPMKQLRQPVTQGGHSKKNGQRYV